MGIIGIWPFAKGNFILKYRTPVTAILTFSLIVLPRLLAVAILWGEWDYIVQSLPNTVVFLISVVKMFNIYTRKKGN